MAILGYRADASPTETEVSSDSLLAGSASTVASCSTSAARDRFVLRRCCRRRRPLAAWTANITPAVGRTWAHRSDCESSIADWKEHKPADGYRNRVPRVHA